MLFGQDTLIVELVRLISLIESMLIKLLNFLANGAIYTIFNRNWKSVFFNVITVSKIIVIHLIFCPKFPRGKVLRKIEGRMLSN